jgi:ARG/rhodanese/phosphatase superfamily protein
MPHVAEIGPIARTLGNILAGEPLRHGALTVIPMLAPMLAEPEWLTLAEAGDWVQVTEVNEAGSVATLTVANMAGRPLLLLDGEELVGAKQNRILNTTVLVAARSEMTIPVSCVEQGRWGYRGRHFAPGDSSLFASVRQKKAAWVTRSIRAGRGHVADQGGVWDELASKTAEHSVESPTGSMRDFYQQYEKEMAEARRALAPVPGQIGALVYLSGRWAGMDLLAGPSLFGRVWLRLCAGYAADAIRRKPSSRLMPSPGAVLRRLSRCPVEAAQAVGLGTEYRLSGPRTVGAALIADDRVAHLMAFPRGQQA